MPRPFRVSGQSDSSARHRPQVLADAGQPSLDRLVSRPRQFALAGLAALTSVAVEDGPAFDLRCCLPSCPGLQPGADR